MKYIYMIFRLFKCPHKWKPYLEGELEKTSNRGVVIAKVYVRVCSKCGDLKTYRINA